MFVLYWKPMKVSQHWMENLSASVHMQLLHSEWAEYVVEVVKCVNQHILFDMCFSSDEMKVQLILLIILGG